MMNLRIGQGYDLHKLSADRKLIIGGVEIPFNKGLVGHSDADVLLHAIIDAILGAAAQGDIGRHFPDTEPAFKGADSIQLLGRAHEVVRQAGFRIVNIDSTIIAQEPKMAPYIDSMREKIATVLEIDIDRISIKAKTNESFDAIGRGWAICSQAVALLSAEHPRGSRKSIISSGGSTDSQ